MEKERIECRLEFKAKQQQKGGAMEDSFLTHLIPHLRITLFLPFSISASKIKVKKLTFCF